MLSTIFFFIFSVDLFILWLIELVCAPYICVSHRLLLHPTDARCIAKLWSSPGSMIMVDQDGKITRPKNLGIPINLVMLWLQ